MIERICFESQLVRVTEQHREIAQLIYDRRPYRYQDAYAHGRSSRELGEAMTWAKAPAWYQLEMLELAHAVMQHPGFSPAAGPDEIEVHRLGDEKPTVIPDRPKCTCLVGDLGFGNHAKGCPRATDFYQPPGASER